MSRLITTIILALMFSGACFAQVPTALSTAEKFIESQKKADRDIVAKIEAAVLMPLNALMSAKDYKNALDALHEDIDELAKKPDGKEIPIVKYDIINKHVDEIEKVLANRDMTGSLKRHLEMLKTTFKEVGRDIDFREKAIDESGKLRAARNKLNENINAFLDELQRLVNEGKLSADFKPSAIRITPPEGAVIITSDTVEAEIQEARDELNNVVYSEVANLVEKGYELTTSIKKIDRLDDWANLLFVKLCVAKADEPEFQNTLLKVLSSSSEEKAVNDKLTFLYAYYTGLVKEHFNQMDEARQAFVRAERFATDREDNIRATSKRIEAFLAKE